MKRSAMSSLAAVLIGTSFLSAQPRTTDETYIARAGNSYISETEFLERFELLPAFGRHRKSQTEVAKFELLYSLIAEKLLAQEAAARHLDRDSLVRLGEVEIRKVLARDELYRAEVISKVGVAPADVDHGIAEATSELRVSFLFFAREEDARFVRSRVKDREDLDRLHVDSTVSVVRDTATVIWGDADQSIEDAVYRLKRGEVSPVIHAGNGFYIMSVTSIRRNDYYAGMTPDVLRERVNTMIRRRRERRRMEEYLGEILRDKTGYSRPAPLRVLASGLAEVCRESPADSMMYLTPPRATALRSLCRSSLQETLAVAGTRVWSVGDVIERLVGKGFGNRRDASGGIAFHLNSELKVMVQQELLGQEGLRRGLDTLPGVRRQVEMWHDSFLAASLKDEVRRRLSVTSSDLWAYARSRDSLVSIPQVRIRELRTSTLDEMQAALAELDKGSTFKQVIQRWSKDTALRAGDGLSDFFPVTERPPVGAIAESMEVGERYGPLQVPGGVLYFELVAKKTDGRVGGDSAWSALSEKAREEVLGRKQKRALTLLLARLGKEQGFEVYADRLRMLTVSPVPMMTFRILGFGGRMFAVPMVDPQLDWLDVESPAGEAVP